MVDVTVARNARDLLVKIDNLTALISQLTTAQSGGFLIESLVFVDPNSGAKVQAVTNEVDATTSATAIQFALSNYNAQLTALNQQLAAL